MDRPNPKYPKAVNVVLGALAFKHDPDEVKSVRYALSRPSRARTPAMLAAFGRGFSRRFVKEPVRVVFHTGARDQFNHRTREIQIGKKEIVRLLHEIGHAKFGESEESAVFYSVGLILKALPDFVPVIRDHILENDPY